MYFSKTFSDPLSVTGEEQARFWTGEGRAETAEAAAKRRAVEVFIVKGVNCCLGDGAMSRADLMDSNEEDTWPSLNIQAKRKST